MSCLVLLETSGNQKYIFETNKLRENVGASELTYRVGTQYVLKAVNDEGGPMLWRESPKEMREAIRQQEACDIEVIFAASGKALLLVKEKGIGEKIISEVTCQALKKAPGIDVCGVVVEVNSSMHKAVHMAHRRLEEVRCRIPGPAQRFLRFPIIDECATSGLPAKRMAHSDIDKLPKDEIGPRSAVSISKLKSSKKYWNTRIKEIVGNKYTLPKATTQLEKGMGCDWLAVIHADGNGIGKIFLDFEKFLKELYSEKELTDRDYIKHLRDFSLALDECTEKAFHKALNMLSLRKCEGENMLPIVPIILGGDDFTAVCDGRQAMRFTKCFIENFEEETRKCDNVKQIMQVALDQSKVTCCAGVAIIKPHYPFYAAYSLAEELISNAKKEAKRDEPYFSAIDFHVLYDASGTDLERIRKSLEVDNGDTFLFARPYAIQNVNGRKNQNIHDLENCIQKIQEKDTDGKRKLPNSVLHELRDGLFHGRKEADSRLNLQLGRRSEEDFGKLISNKSLFLEKEEKYYTGLLDAMELAEFWEGKQS